MKKLVTVQDISCIGKCSCTAALPIISSYGIEALVLPTALLSSHTDGFGENTFLDLTDEMKKIISHWKTLDLSLDGIYTGYLGSVEQIDIVADFIRSFRKEKTVTLVDPVMGDGGRYYKYFSDEYLEKNKKLCSMADIITPNITEACLLTGEEYFVEYSEKRIPLIIQKLHALGTKNVVITGLHFGDDIGYVCSDTSDIKIIKEPRHKNVRFAGTGDVFASSLVACVTQGKSFFDSVRCASEFTEKCIDATDDKTRDFYYGLCFENVLKGNNK